MQRLGKRNQFWSETEIPVRIQGRGPGDLAPLIFRPEFNESCRSDNV